MAALKTLAASAPKSFQQKMAATAEVNAQIADLAAKLGIPTPRLGMNLDRAIEQLETLQGRLAMRDNPAPPAAPALSQAGAPDAPVARPVELTGNATTDKWIADSGCKSLSEFKAKAKRDRLFAVASALPPGSAARACAEANLAAAQTALNNLA
jgi:hypothetical protein